MKQAPRHMHPVFVVKVEAEVDKLATVDFIREVQYHILLANIVLINRKN